ncbi:MAG TPA: phosphodiesterase [Burkholderiales bacterium]|nr:phosphodiesterase [Burkholderiales bacterium]
MIVAQLSDLHIGVEARSAYARFDTAASLARCVQHLSGLKPRPDAVLATGDLADGGSREEYRRLRALLAPLPAPVYLIPGNHDRREELLAEFGDHDYLPRRGAPLAYAVEHHPVRLIALDTVVPEAEGGALDAAQLEWLARALSVAPRRPTLIFMHHPPFATGLGRMDAIGLAPQSAARLREIVARHPQVERIVCGHVHRPIQARWGGTVVSICPSTAYQCRLDLDTGRFEPAPEEPPAYQLHYWNGAELVTHTIAVTAPPGE